MTTIRPFRPTDLFKITNVNLDPKTETFGTSYYLHYLNQWPEYFTVAESPTGEIMGYIMGKAEGRGDNWHGHVTCLTVAPQYRRLGLAASLMKSLEQISDEKRAYFVDLFVRVSNKTAVEMYKRLGYVIYRRIINYYSGETEEDAYDMRKALSRDINNKSVIPLDRPVSADEIHS